MTNEEAKQALIDHSKVEYNGSSYILSAIIYKCIRGRIAASALLTPLNGANSQTEAKIKDISRRDENA